MASKKRGDETDARDEGPASSLLDVDALRRIVELLETTEITRLSWRRGPEGLLINRGHGPPPLLLPPARRCCRCRTPRVPPPRPRRLHWGQRPLRGARTRGTWWPRPSSA